MFRVKPFTLVVVIAVFATTLSTASAAFTLVSGFDSVTVNPPFPSPVGPPPAGSTTAATGLISTNSFITWAQYADAVPSPTNILTSVLSNSNVPIASVRLVSNSASNPTQTAPTPLPTGTNTLERRITGPSYNADFTGNEALLFANATNSALIIDFAVPVSGAGLRVQDNAFGTNNTFFLQGFNDNGAGFSAATPLFNNLSVTTSTFTPFGDSAPFYGIQGSLPGETFTRLWVGFTGTPGFAISTLEFISAGTADGAVPAPPTLLLGLVAPVLVTGIRRFRRCR